MQTSAADDLGPAEQQELDSFKHISIKEIVHSYNEGKIIDRFLNTSRLKFINGKFELNTTFYQYDHPVETSYKQTFTNQKHRIVITKDTLTNNRVYIDNIELLPGKNIIPVEGFDEFSHLDFDAPHELSLNGREIILMRAFLEGCNGTACRATIHFIWDVRAEKGIVYDQYNMRDFVVGEAPYSGEFSFLYFSKPDYAYYLKASGYSADAYIFTNKGNAEKAKDLQGKNYFFKGFTKGEVDSIFITDANYPFIRQ